VNGSYSGSAIVPIVVWQQKKLVESIVTKEHERLSRLLTLLELELVFDGSNVVMMDYDNLT